MSTPLSTDLVSANGSDMAFPCEGPNTTAYGLTKRELFAALCMQATITGDIGDNEHMAHDAVRRADALLAALAKDAT